MGRPKKNSSPASSYTPKKIQGLEGVVDVITESDILWDLIVKRLYKVSRIYGFSRIEPNFLEDPRLYENFYRSAQDGMLSVILPEGLDQRVALRPSFLPSVLRSYYQHKIFETAYMSKWAYTGWVDKKDNITGKLLADYEFGFEILGNFNHLTEAQVIGGVWEFLLSLGLKDLSLEINNIGKAECQRVYQGSLADYLSGKKYELCDACNEHLGGRVLNVFRCNNLDCQAVLSEAPTVLDFLDPESHKHFTNILEALDELGVPYQLNPFYAGPDGHSRTNLVIKCKTKSGSQVLGEGGYHDDLMQNLCGKNYCCFGFSGSLLQIREALESGKVSVSKEQSSEVFLVPLGELASKKSLRLFRDLTNQKIGVYDHFGNLGVKNQLKQAETFKASIALIMGQKEAMDEMVILRDVKSGMQEVISYDKIVEDRKSVV